MADFGSVFGQQGFDANKVEPNAGFDILPAGDYDACIVKSEMQQNKAGTGSYLKLQLQIVGGEFQNRVLFDQLNINNPSDQAKQIALGQLSSICRAVNVLTPKDSTELHDKTMRITVKVKDDKEYGKQNKITAYKARAAGGAQVTPASNNHAAPTAPGAPAAPWKQAG